MTDKQIMECKYKFQSIEKFAGKPYCTLHNETCEFINFVCDKNCQVYEDYKQHKRKEQRIVELNKTIKAKKKECKELKEAQKNSRCAWKSFEGTFCPEAQEQLDQLKAELTRANCQIADDEILQCDMIEAIEELKAENENWQKEYWKLEQGNDFWAEKNSRLKGCLTEIKEIAEKLKNFYEELGKCEDLTVVRLKQILQKISEVEE